MASGAVSGRESGSSASTGEERSWEERMGEEGEAAAEAGEAATDSFRTCNQCIPLTEQAQLRALSYATRHTSLQEWEGSMTLEKRRNGESRLKKER